MRIECCKCGAELIGPCKKFKRFVASLGWTFFEVDGVMYWRCKICGPHGS
jgi:hypothetical protein